MKIKKTVVQSLACLLTAAMLAAPVSAYTYSNAKWLNITKPRTYSATHKLGSANKEYGQVAVNTGDKKSVELHLYKKTLTGRTWYGKDQILAYGSNKRAWWVGDTKGSYNYQIWNQKNAGPLTLSGWFRNFQ